MFLSFGNIKEMGMKEYKSQKMGSVENRIYGYDVVIICRNIYNSCCYLKKDFYEIKIVKMFRKRIFLLRSDESLQFLREESYFVLVLLIVVMVV